VSLLSYIYQFATTVHHLQSRESRMVDQRDNASCLFLKCLHRSMRTFMQFRQLHRAKAIRASNRVGHLGCQLLQTDMSLVFGEVALVTGRWTLLSWMYLVVSTDCEGRCS
jgi:hypothetical protein